VRPLPGHGSRFARAAGELEAAVRLAKVDTESQQQLAARFNIRSIPTLAIFKGGREIARQSGAVDARHAEALGARAPN
jgi:thioredoxin 2